MLGHVLLESLRRDPAIEATGAARSARAIARLPRDLVAITRLCPDARDFEALGRFIVNIRPKTLVNCIGVIKQAPEANDPAVAIPINAELPHHLATVAEQVGARLIHISTDCVYSGRRGGYLEEDESDATDLYGQSKARGEVRDSPHAVTLRTSIIGRELASRHGLVEWFLSTDGVVEGFRKAIFSGFTTVELAKIIHQVVLPRRTLSGLLNVASAPISKYDLLRLLRERYSHPVTISPVEEPVIDRSLCGDLFTSVTAYRAPTWPEMIASLEMQHLIETL